MLSSCAVVEPGKAQGSGTADTPAPPAPRVGVGAQPPAMPPPLPVPPTPAPVDVRQALQQARIHLNQGEEEPALVELKRVLEVDPDNKTALSFMRQIQDDPKVLYGRASQAYRVAAGDTMAHIAQRGLSDPDQFYGLARYNGLKVPGDLKVGQTIQVPGTKRLAPASPKDPGPLREPAAVTAAPPADTKAADEKKAADERVAADKKRKAEEGAAAEARKKDIARQMALARAAMKRQDICGAIKLYDAVLKLDPDHQAAQLERTRAVELNARLGSKQC